VFTLAKLIMITPATATSDTHHCSCLGHLGRCDTDRIVSISCCAAQGGQGKYCNAAQGDCRVSLSPTVMLTNVVNVNDHEAVFTLAKLRAITPTTETSDSHHCTCLGHLGQCDTDRIVSIYYRAAQGVHGKYYVTVACRCH
jgi:hypothetical protein